MKPCFRMVGCVLFALLMAGCDLDPVTWDGTKYMPLERPSDPSGLDGGLDGGETDTDGE